MRLEPPPSTLPPGSTVWAYLRDSGGPTQDRSVEQQRQMVEEYCQQFGLVLVLPPFEDVHRSGTTTRNRNEFDYMMSLSASEHLRPMGLLIWNHARFSRGDPNEAQFFKSTLRARKIVIHSLTDKIPDGPFAPIVESIIEVANKQKAEEAAFGAWRGLRYIVKQGAVPGTPPRGLRRVPILVTSEQGVQRTAHRWEPDPRFERRIQHAFELRAAGKSLAQIHRAVHLFTSLNSYTTFFQNPIYIGTLKYGEMIIEKYCPAIVSKKTWNKVQALLTTNAGRKHLTSTADHPRRVNASYLLSGLIHCARCGAAMNGLTSRQKSGSDYRRYRCGNSKQRLDCAAKPIPAALAEKLVLTHIKKFFEDETNLVNLLSQFAENQAGHHAEANAAIASHRAELGTVRKKMTNTSNAIAELSGSVTLLKQLRALEAQETELIAKIRELENQKNTVIHIPTTAEARTLSEKIIDDLNDTDPVHVRQILLGLVYQILADRQGKSLVLQVILTFDKKKAPPSKSTVSINRVPVGAPIYRHSLIITYTIQNQGNPIPVK